MMIDDVSHKWVLLEMFNRFQQISRVSFSIFQHLSAVCSLASCEGWMKSTSLETVPSSVRFDGCRHVFYCIQPVLPTNPRDAFRGSETTLSKMTAMVITHHMDLMCLRIAIVQLFTKGASWRAAITTYLINVDSTLDAPNPFISLYLYYPCGKMKQTMPTAGYSHNSHEAKQESEVSEDGTNGRSCKCERSS